MSIKLRTYFALTFALFIFITTVFLSITISKQSSKKLEKEVGDSLAGVAFQMADKLDYFMWSRFQEIQVFSQLEALENPNRSNEAQKLLDQLHTSIPTFSWVGTTDNKGIVTASSGKILKNVDISERPVFKEALDKPFIGDVHNALLLAKWLPTQDGEPLQLVDISTPIIGNDGKFKGVLAAHLSWEWTKEVKNIVLQPLQGKRDDVELFIVSSKDQTVLLGPKNMLGKPLKLSNLESVQFKRNDWKLERWPDGKRYLTGYAFGKGYKNYRGLGWTVIVRQPEDVAFSSVNHLNQLIFIIGTIFSILMAVLGWFLAGIVSTPLFKITQAANKLRHGENVEIPYFKGIKDIEILSLSLRELVASLVKTESELGKMENIAMHDALTGLPNRLSLYTYLNEKLVSDHTHQSNFLLYLDLDGFKLVNDSFGHHVGDILLNEVGIRIKSCLNNDQFVARLGGDEFVVMISTVTPSPIQVANQIADQIIRELNRPFFIQGHKVQVGCSIGAALLTEKDTTPEEILQLADHALYISKNEGKNQVNFYPNKNRVS
ncbi:sensor domain-containing diguanylate cyclase [Fictibacillus barbaricus]|uniref:Diguanylate cyclase (GGDEF)-like protein n=1 Tax=Fictibacillus barbaricus TaxID=182136 RepID=A0ABU1TYY0_9BACL|nr:diguanylate cyclase [Fictibacillus barbaricus]MDR7072397.1 diguanylate cyclase (GGDEF)-like protein [Fictibacillus barbaricus]